MDEAGAQAAMTSGAVRVSIHRGLKIPSGKVRDEDR